MSEIYVITGATGNTGKVIVDILLNRGKKVRVLGRNTEKLKHFAAQGAETMTGELSNGKFLQTAFTGAQAVYTLIPPNFQADDFRGYQNTISDAVVKAIEVTSVRYAVTLSSVGAHLKEKAGVVQGLYDMEQKLNRLKGLNVLHLRPSYFMENLFGQLGMIKQMGIIGSPIKGDLRFPIVATQDIGQLAAEKLLELNFKGTSVQYVLGPRDVSYNEIAPVLGRAIGKPDLKYVEFPYEDTKQAMMQTMGLSTSSAGAMVEFMQSMNEGLIMKDAIRNTENTTPTSIEQFAQVFARVYAQK